MTYNLRTLVGATSVGITSRLVTLNQISICLKAVRWDGDGRPSCVGFSERHLSDEIDRDNVMNISRLKMNREDPCGCISNTLSLVIESKIPLVPMLSSQRPNNSNNSC